MSRGPGEIEKFYATIEDPYRRRMRELEREVVENEYGCYSPLDYIVSEKDFSVSTPRA
jgi:hypothetical protein